MADGAAGFSTVAGIWSERRANSRFPIEQDVRYRLLGSKKDVAPGVGKTLNMSSSGILFAADSPLAKGRHVEISVNWPAQLNGKCPLKLVARGWVTRCRGTQVAIEIEKYEFRTRGVKSAPAN